MGKVRNAFGCGIAPLRPLLGLIAAALLAGAIACGSSYHGVVAVGPPSDKELIAITLERHEVSRYKTEHSSQDGGLSWTVRDKPLAIPAEWPQRDHWHFHSYVRKAVDTPRGSYRIDGADIQLHTPDGEYQTVYSATHLESPSNQWLQYQKLQGDTGPDINPSSGPRSITYDPSSGNVIVAMGVLGVVVGTPDGSWTTVEVGGFRPINFSGLTRVGALLSSLDLWVAVFAFSFSMIAIAFAVVSAVSKFPPSVLGGFALIFVRLPLIALSMLLAAILLANIGVNGNRVSHDILFLILLFSVFFSLVSLIFLVAEAWILSRRPLAVTAGAFAAMMVFVLLPFMAWAMLGEYLTFVRAVSVALCAAVALGLIVYCVRTARKYVAPHS